MISQGCLKEILYYNPSFGIFVRTKNRSNYKAGSIAGYENKEGYITIKINDILYSAHRLAFLYMEGFEPPKIVDHINGIKSDNRWSNIRHIDIEGNAKNSKRSKNNKSGVTGVCWNIKSNGWVVYISHEKKNIHLGTRAGFFDACCLRKSAENEYNYHINHDRYEIVNPLNKSD